VKGVSEGDAYINIRRDFDDTLDKKESLGGIIVNYMLGEVHMPTLVGVPYKIENSWLLVGRYQKGTKETEEALCELGGVNSVPLEGIQAYQRFELPRVMRFGMGLARTRV
ncbi:MAG: hypothetical protein AABX66_01335, partial [Nanoarchaeota archaeon]